MAFDPQQYLKEKMAATAPAQPPVEQPGAPFDPAAYLAAKQMPAAPAAPAPEVGKLESLLRGAAQGGTLGFADEIVGGVESLFTDKTYDQARDESRANFKAADDANPITSGIGNVAGGLSSMLIPGLGAGTGMAATGKLLSKVPGIGGALSGSMLAKAATMGAGLGAVEGAGRSVATDMGGIGDDALSGAAMGGVLGGGSELATSAIGAAGRAAGGYMKQAFEPTMQRLQAFGIDANKLKSMGGLRVAKEGIDEAQRLVGFTRPDGKSFTTPEFFGAVDGKMDEIYAGIKSAVDGTNVDLPDEASYTFLDRVMGRLKEDGLATDQDLGNKIIGDLLTDIEGAQGNVGALHELKKKFGAEIKWSQDIRSIDPPIKTKLYKEATVALNDILIEHMNNVSKAVGGAVGDEVKKRNAQYANLSKLWPTLKESADKFELLGDTAGRLKVSDQLKGAGVGAGLGSVIGVPGLGAAAGLATAVGSAALRSTSGRLARAKIGETLGLGQMGAAVKAAGDQAAQIQGLIPRTLQGVREWLQANPNRIPSQIAQTAKDIMTMPDAAAEIQVRALMPLFDQFVAPSPYKSEFNGKISSPEDRVTARQIIMAQGLPPSVASFHVSVLNKSGKLQDYHYAKPKGDYGDELVNFNQRLTEMGY